MKSVLDATQRNMVHEFLLSRLKQRGKTIRELGITHPGDAAQLPYADHPVWHKKSDLDEWVASKLRLPPSLWGPKRHSNTLMIQTTLNLSKFRKNKTIADWNTKKRTTVFRLIDLSVNITIPKMTSNTRKSNPQNNYDMKTVFSSIISNSRKDNTYKFALGKTLLDYCKKNSPTGHVQEISYDYLASEFLRHYWYQKYKFKMKQDFYVKKTPVIIQILNDVFGEKSEYKFQDLDKDKIRRAKNEILENIFGSSRQKKGMVIQRFQRIPDGTSVTDADVFYEYDDEKKKLFLKPKAHEFFNQNNNLLSLALLGEWIRYLEKANHGLPMLAAKIYDEDPQRKPLTKFKNAFLQYGDHHSGHCFYCNNKINSNHIHVDHFIPWSYIFSDNAWNLVLSCQDCNLGKHSSLPEKKFINELVDRDYKYAKTMNIMRDSIKALSIKGSWKNEINNHYRICHEYGFGRWHLGNVSDLI